jgi:GNAT superfamily N-acetyltransferase
MEIQIRKAEQTDYKQIVDLFKEFATFEKHPEKMINSVEKMTREKEYFNCFVAETSDKQIVGYATYFFCYFTWSGKSLYMDDLYVKPDFRGNGLGSTLIKKVIDFAKESGCYKLHWQVSKWNNPAIEFYKSLGADIGHEQMNCNLVF